MKRSKSGRLHYNKIVMLLSKIYEISYKVCYHYYNRFKQNVAVTKLHLSRIYNTGLQLETIW